MVNFDAKGIPAAEPRSFKPDKFLTPKAVEVLQNLKGQPIVTDQFPVLFGELDGFKDTPDILSMVAGHVERWFLSPDYANIVVDDVLYDPVGLIGVKFNTPDFQALVIQPDEDGDGLSRINIVAGGIRHEYKMLGGDLTLGHVAKLDENKSTYNMLKNMGVDVENMDR